MVKKLVRRLKVSVWETREGVTTIRGLEVSLREKASGQFRGSLSAVRSRFFFPRLPAFDHPYALPVANGAQIETCAGAKKVFRSRANFRPPKTIPRPATGLTRLPLIAARRRPSVQTCLRRPVPFRAEFGQSPRQLTGRRALNSGPPFACPLAAVTTSSSASTRCTNSGSTPGSAGRRPRNRAGRRPGGAGSAA